MSWTSPQPTPTSQVLSSLQSPALSYRDVLITVYPNHNSNPALLQQLPSPPLPSSAAVVVQRAAKTRRAATLLQPVPLAHPPGRRGNGAGRPRYVRLPAINLYTPGLFASLCHHPALLYRAYCRIRRLPLQLFPPCFLIYSAQLPFRSSLSAALADPYLAYQPKPEGADQNKPKRPRGRPPKNPKTTSDTAPPAPAPKEDDADEGEPPKKKRGRPPKSSGSAAE